MLELLYCTFVFLMTAFYGYQHVFTLRSWSVSLAYLLKTLNFVYNLQHFHIEECEHFLRQDFCTDIEIFVLVTMTIFGMAIIGGGRRGGQHISLFIFFLSLCISLSFYECIYFFWLFLSFSVFLCMTCVDYFCACSLSLSLSAYKYSATHIVTKNHWCVKKLYDVKKFCTHHWSQVTKLDFMILFVWKWMNNMFRKLGVKISKDKVLYMECF